MFWSYLWGIEIRNFQVLLCILVFVLILPMRDWNISMLYDSHNCMFRFDLTYEGLKYGLEIDFGQYERSVLILPMRDWNQKFLWFVWFFSFRFWSYLWGIEILVPVTCMQSCSLPFWSYLWGIEIYEWLEKRTLWRSFDLTYEGLK